MTVKHDGCGECGAYIPPFCLLCDGFQTARFGAVTFCMECQDATLCPCRFVWDEDHVITFPLDEIAWYLHGLPMNSEFPRALSEEDAKRMVKAGVDLRNEFEVAFFLAHGRLPEPEEVPDE